MYAEELNAEALHGFAKPDVQPVTAQLIVEHASVTPGGKTRIGVHFDIEEGWHIYAKEPGDAGLPTKIVWQATPGASFGQLQWPAHEPFHDPGNITTFGYAGTAVLYTTLKVKRSAAGRVLPIRARVEWLACKEICLPGSADLELALPVGVNPQVFSAHAQLFEHAP